jgi:hypothetical protein
MEPAPFNIGGRVESRRRQHNLDRYYQEQTSGRWGRSEPGDPRITPVQGMGSSGYGTGAYSGADVGASGIYTNTDRALEIARRMWERDKRGLEAANYRGQYTPELRYDSEYHQYQPYCLAGYGPEFISDIDQSRQTGMAERQPAPGSYGRNITGSGSFTMPQDSLPPQNQGNQGEQRRWRRIDV